MTAPTKTASQQIRAALVERGYRRMTATQYLEKDGPHRRTLDRYFHPQHCRHLTLEIVYEEAGREEIGCALWQELAADTNDVAETIAAIP